MRRRAFLATSAALLTSGIAGCLDSAGGGTLASSDDPGASPDDVSLTATVERLQPSVVNLGESGASVVGDGHQYLLYRVEVTAGDPPARLDFAFRLGGRVYSPGVATAGRLHPGTFDGPRYDAHRGSGWLVFELPEAWTARHAALSLHGREWPVGDAIRDRLAAKPPQLSVSWDVETTAAGDATHRFDVSNPTDRDTRFVAALTASSLPDAESPLAVLNRLIPGGGSESWETSTAGPPAESTGDGAVKYRLQWGRGQQEQTVDFESRASE